MDSASEPSARSSVAGPLVLTALVGASLASAMFAGDGSGTRGTLPVGGGALLVLTAALVVVSLGRLPAPRLGRAGAVLLGSFVLLVAWIGTTVWWSIVPDRSWDAFNKSIAYVAFLGLGFVLAGLGPGDRSATCGVDARHRHRYDAGVGARHEGRAGARR
jgi:hypothetical protein